MRKRRERMPSRTADDGRRDILRHSKRGAMKYTPLAVSLLTVLGFLARPVPVSAASSDREVSGNLVVDGRTVPLEHAYLDVTDPDEPIVVLSDKALPAEAVPFIPEKLVKGDQIHAIAFSLSRKDGKLTNTFGKVYCPGHELGVGLGRVEEGNVSLSVTRDDATEVDGSVATVKPVTLSYISYAFSLTFRAKVAAPKK
jgi:hypothetical protein